MIKNKELYKAVKLHILKKLFDQKRWMHRHTNINNLPKGLPSHLKGHKIVKKVIEGLIKERLIIGKPTHYGLEISLNIKKRKEIENFIETNLI